jgi:hypothetical protein
MNDRTTAYFDGLVIRAVAARAIPRTPAPGMKPNDCHANCEAYVRSNPEMEVVRGWLAMSGTFFIPHSMVRHRASGRLVDITPDAADSGTIPFVEHIGTDDDFRILRKGRDGGWLHPPLTGLPSDYAPPPDVPL